MKNLRNTKIGLFILLCLFYIPVYVSAQAESNQARLLSFVQNVIDYSYYIPQEKVYIHTDNTDYFIGETIWFKSYISSSRSDTAKVNMSKVLYVELLTSEGHVIIDKKLKIENGQCHGELFLNSKLIYTGFYELRAYTRYMTNFGEEHYFSRVIPIYRKPETVGNYENRDIRAVKKHQRPEFRKKLNAQNNINISFYPEGGNLVKGIESKVAFKATNKSGIDINITGSVIDSRNNIVTTFTTQHQGMGYFVLTPDENKYTVKVGHDGESANFSLPKIHDNGYVLGVDNSADSVLHAKVFKSTELQPTTIGAVIMNRGHICNFMYIDMESENNSEFTIDKSTLPAGVSEILLFDTEGQILADRFFFVKQTDKQLTIKKQTNKNSYSPYEKVDISFEVKDALNKPKETSFSLAVKDTETGFSSVQKDNVMIYNLLSSEIKGFIVNPEYYFEADSPKRRQNLDLLMLVQGWRRYDWNKMIDTIPKKMQQRMETALTIDGTVKSWIHKVNKPNMDVSFSLMKKEDNSILGASANCITDSLGNFAFYIDEDLYGDWHLLLRATEKGKANFNRIMLNSLYEPSPRIYNPYETLLQKRVKSKRVVNDKTDTEIVEDNNWEKEFEKYFDPSLSMTERIHQLDDVVISASKSTYSDDEISESSFVYDAEKSIGKILDKGGDVATSILDFLPQLDPNFVHYPERHAVYYKNMQVTFIVNNLEMVEYLKKRSQKYDIRAMSVKDIPTDDIIKIVLSYDGKTIVNFDENGDLGRSSVKKRMYPMYDVKSFVPVSQQVFVFVYTNDNPPFEYQKATRQNTFSGYSVAQEFYSPNHSEMLLPDENDHRRTLYWNPNVKTDKDGKASIGFYNNSSATTFDIDAQTVTANDEFGILDE